jgi:hypothetical protein
LAYIRKYTTFVVVYFYWNKNKMSEKYNPSSPNLEPHEPTTLLYRGVGVEHNRERIGSWWTTNPYYALVYASGGEGNMFVASIDTDKLTQLAYDVSQDEGYENYGFVEQDPPGARIVTQGEIEALIAISQSAAEADNIDVSTIPGGQEQLLRTPDEPIQAGRLVFEHTFELEQ